MVLGLLLLFNGLRMVRREGRSLSNLLSLLLGLGMIVATVVGATLFFSGTTPLAVAWASSSCCSPATPPSPRQLPALLPRLPPPPQTFRSRRR